MEADDLPLTSVEFEVPDRNPEVIRFSAFDARWEWSDRTGTCTQVEDSPPVGPGEIVSPDRAWVAFRRDGNVWVRSRDGQQEFALTDDAEPHRDYGGLPEAATKVKLPLLGLDSVLVAAWSPDSTRLVTHRIDQRELPEQVLVEAGPVRRRAAGGTPYPLPDARRRSPGDDDVARPRHPYRAERGRVRRAGGIDLPLRWTGGGGRGRSRTPSTSCTSPGTGARSSCAASTRAPVR
ncbi:DPP IV N-terminal domain-containing protein [Streptomonospora alba]|uniref:DPP IV N-terminal domain-containing protein n=1 Tax=Streptomonospora alba TaxID=183763 RepID=UPI00069BF404|nr:DPP IV N-terminal domain-containing protein [Streptomonospora alba]